jgi:hypothetical protein
MQNEPDRTETEQNGSGTTMNLAGITKPPQTRRRRLEQTVVRRAAPLIAPPACVATFYMKDLD